MKKIILFTLTVLSLKSFSQEEKENHGNFFTVDLRFSENPTYPRVYCETDSKHNWGFTFGYNADARGLLHVEGTYKILHGVKLALGIGNHPYQGNFHLATGIIFKNEFSKNWELEGYGRMIFNHTDYFGSEIEFHKKFKGSSIGIATEIESGKKFLLWEDAKEQTHDGSFETESVFLIGPTGSIKVTEHITVRGVFLLGKQLENNENNFFWKGGIGAKYVF